MFQKSMGGLPSSEHKSKKVFSKRLSQTSNPCSKVISKDKSSNMWKDDPQALSLSLTLSPRLSKKICLCPSPSPVVALGKKAPEKDCFSSSVTSCKKKLKHVTTWEEQVCKLCNNNKQNKQPTYLPKYLPLRILTNNNKKQGYQNQQTKQFVCPITLKEEVHPDHEPIFQNPLLLWEGESSKKKLWKEKKPKKKRKKDEKRKINLFSHTHTHTHSSTSTCVLDYILEAPKEAFMSIWVHKQKKHHLHTYTHTHTHHNKWYSEGARNEGRPTTTKASFCKYKTTFFFLTNLSCDATKLL